MFIGDVVFFVIGHVELLDELTWIVQSENARARGVGRPFLKRARLDVNKVAGVVLETDS